MKSMMKTLLLLGVISLSIVACKKDAKNTRDEIPQDVKNKIADLGFNENWIAKTDGGYLVEGDIFISNDRLNESVSSPALRIANDEQYRTYNLVTGLPRTITVSVSTGSPSYFITAADEAINRYNAENLQLTFQRVSGTADINIVTFYEVSNVLGSAGFPSNGNPYNQIRMNTYHYNAGTNTNYLASIMAHEMGHCIGFRHTDYMRRNYSCGPGGGKEQAGSIGAVLIPGTPSGPDAASWMLACSNGTDRPFNANDKIALNYLY